MENEVSRNHPEYKKALEKAKAQGADEVYRVFDYWQCSVNKQPYNFKVSDD